MPDRSTMTCPARVACTAGLLAGGLALASCAPQPEDLASGRAVQPVVYAQDDRQDVYAHPDAMLRDLAQRSIVAFVQADNVNAADPAHVMLTSQPLSMTQNLCPGERFADDPTAAHCSGTLIGDDLVLTAGHCFEGADAAARTASCRGQRLVFGYYRDAADTMHTITSDDVFQCTDVVVWRNGMDGQRNLDYAVVRLDRAATPRFRAVPIRRGGAAVAAMAPLAVIGFGSGVPAKIDTGGRVVDPRAEVRDYFLADTDTFQGNSGSGVFDPSSRELVGILVRGATDYVANGGCQVMNHCAAVDPSSATCGGESINYPQPMLDELCAMPNTMSACRGARGGCAVAPTAAGATRPTSGALGAMLGAALALGGRARRRRRRDAR